MFSHSLSGPSNLFLLLSLSILGSCHEFVSIATEPAEHSMSIMLSRLRGGGVHTAMSLVLCDLRKLWPALSTEDWPRVPSIAARI